MDLIILRFLIFIGILQILSRWPVCPACIIYLRKTWQNGFTRNRLKNTHDMALPSWGPYSNKYNGISHVPAENNGIRFDVIVQPSLYLRNQTVLANTQRESGYHPGRRRRIFLIFSYRYELEWKDKVYCDVSFSSVDEKSRLIKAEFVNNTTSNRSLALNMFSTIIFPYSKRVRLFYRNRLSGKKRPTIPVKQIQ